MKKVFVIVALLFGLGIKIKAQDVVVKIDKTEIKAKVLELTDGVIKYKKFEIQDGPIYTIKKSDVFMIIYQNGRKEYMENTVVPVKHINRDTIFGGGQASILSTTASIENTSTVVISNAVVGFKIGFFIANPLTEKLTLTSGVNYVRKGTKNNVSRTYTSPNTTDYSTTKIGTSFIEIPSNILYTFEGTKGFVVGLGLVTSFGIGGSYDHTRTFSNPTYPTQNANGSVKFDGNDLKLVEWSGNLILGYKFSPKSSVYFTLNKAFSNIAGQDAPEYTKYQTSYFGLTFSTNAGFFIRHK